VSKKYLKNPNRTEEFRDPSSEKFKNQLKLLGSSEHRLRLNKTKNYVKFLFSSRAEWRSRAERVREREGAGERSSESESEVQQRALDAVGGWRLDEALLIRPRQ
jgi:hypothetical protein